MWSTFRQHVLGVGGRSRRLSPRKEREAVLETQPGVLQESAGTPTAGAQSTGHACLRGDNIQKAVIRLCHHLADRKPRG